MGRDLLDLAAGQAVGLAATEEREQSGQVVRHRGGGAAKPAECGRGLSGRRPAAASASQSMLPRARLAPPTGGDELDADPADLPKPIRHRPAEVERLPARLVQVDDIGARPRCIYGKSACCSRIEAVPTDAEPARQGSGRHELRMPTPAVGTEAAQSAIARAAWHRASAAQVAPQPRCPCAVDPRRCRPGRSAGRIAARSSGPADAQAARGGAASRSAPRWPSHGDRYRRSASEDRAGETPSGHARRLAGRREAHQAAVTSLVPARRSDERSRRRSARLVGRLPGPDLAALESPTSRRPPRHRAAAGAPASHRRDRDHVDQVRPRTSAGDARSPTGCASVEAAARSCQIADRRRPAAPRADVAFRPDGVLG